MKACRCDEIYMKRSSCARAYLKGGCKTCHALYVDLNKGHKNYTLLDNFGGIEAFRIRKGCSLTIYEDEYLMGESKVFDEEIVEVLQ